MVKIVRETIEKCQNEVRETERTEWEEKVVEVRKSQDDEIKLEFAFK